MNLLDLILIIIISVSSIYGLLKGLIREVFSILAVIIGLAAASLYCDKLSPFLRDFGLNDQVSNILSFVILFIIVLIAVLLVGKLIHRLVHATFLGWLNRLGGVGFGFIRGAITSSIIIIILTITLSEKAPILHQSKLTPHFMNISKALLSLASEDLANFFISRRKS